MNRYRVTVDYGDDHIRTYLVTAENIDQAEVYVTDIVTSDLLTVSAFDDADEWNDYDYDGEF